ncbi:MAG: hypothetical protein ABW007_08045 [Chitinophagaceae bacterium]
MAGEWKENLAVDPQHGKFSYHFLPVFPLKYTRKVVVEGEMLWFYAAKDLFWKVAVQLVIIKRCVH